MANDENKIILEFPATNVEIEFGETITFDNISGFLDSGRVTYNGDSLTEEITDLEDSITDLEDSITDLEDSKADTTYVNEELAKKADKTDTYTKSQVDTKLDAKANANSVYTKTQVDNKLSEKADVADLPDMTQYYDKSEVDDLLDDKADKSDTYTKEQVDDIVYGILPDDTASGSVANFETDLALPLKSLEVDVNAVQSGSGDPSPDNVRPISGWSSVNVTRCGKNLLGGITLGNAIVNAVNNQTYSKFGSDTNGNFVTITASGAVHEKSFTNSIKFKENTQYTLILRLTRYQTGTKNGNIAIHYTDGTKSGILFSTSSNTEVITHVIVTTLGKTVKAVATEWGGGTTYLFYESSGIFEGVLAVEDYEAYNGTTEVINLGGTNYGGHFTQDKDGHRQFEVAHGFIASYNGETINEPWISSEDVYSQGATPTTGAQVVYPLTTPVIIDLPDGEPIITLNGTNNIYADTGDTSVVFKNSVNGYVENKIASVQALTLNT